MWDECDIVLCAVANGAHNLCEMLTDDSLFTSRRPLVKCVACRADCPVRSDILNSSVRENKISLALHTIDVAPSRQGIIRNKALSLGPHVTIRTYKYCRISHEPWPESSDQFLTSQVVGTTHYH